MKNCQICGEEINVRHYATNTKYCKKCNERIDAGIKAEWQGIRSRVLAKLKAEFKTLTN